MWSIQYPLPTPDSLPENRCIPEGLCTVSFFNGESEACPQDGEQGCKASLFIHTVSTSATILMIWTLSWYKTYMALGRLISDVAEFIKLIMRKSIS